VGFNGHLGIALDAAAIYISDLSNQRIRKVDTTGNITTVAGNGVRENSAMAPPLPPQPGRPIAVAVDAAATCISRIRRQSRAQGERLGIISTAPEADPGQTNGDGDWPPTPS